MNPGAVSGHLARGEPIVQPAEGWPVFLFPDPPRCEGDEADQGAALVELSLGRY